jgi:hypothetical protein
MFKIENEPKWMTFETVSNIQSKSLAVLDSIKAFHCAFEAWKKLRDCCICSQGDYF